MLLPWVLVPVLVGGTTIDFYIRNSYGSDQKNSNAVLRIINKNFPIYKLVPTSVLLKRFENMKIPPFCVWLTSVLLYLSTLE